MVSVGPREDAWRSTPSPRPPPGPPHKHPFYSEQTHFSLNFLLLLSLRQTHLFSKCWGTRLPRLLPLPHSAGLAGSFLEFTASVQPECVPS